MKNEKEEQKREEQKREKQSKKDHAINEKGDISDGNQINPQVEKRKDTHQPRDNA